MARNGPTVHKSLIRNLVWGLTLPTVVLIVASIAILTNRLSGTVSGVRQATLTSQADDILGHVTRGRGGALELELPESLQRLYGPREEFAYAILDASGKAVLASRDQAPLSPVDTATLTPGVNYFLLPREPGRNPIYGATVGFDRGGTHYWIQVMQGGLHDDVIFDTVVEEFFETSGWVFILLLVLLLATNIVIIARSLRPLRLAQLQAAAIGPATTDIRLREEGMPAEIVPLIRAVNSAFNRLEEGFRLQRDFTASAAHELRTPLAILMARIGRLHDKQEAETLMKDARLMNRIVSQLLKISQLEAIRIGPEERADLSAVAVDAAVYLGPVAIERRRSIAVTGTEAPVMVRGNGDLLGHAVRNLVENALQHTPEGTTVTIAVTPEGTLSVSDDGPGIPPDLRRQIFERFWRADRSGPGAGLGLSIVDRIVRLHGGTVSVSDSADPDGKCRGATFTIRLPGAVSRP
jgi:signal transduction histidine kinase